MRVFQFRDTHDDDSFVNMKCLKDVHDMNYTHKIKYQNKSFVNIQHPEQNTVYSILGLVKVTPL